MVRRVPLAEPLRQIPQRNALLGDVRDGIEEQAIVLGNPAVSARLTGEQWFDSEPVVRGISWRCIRAPRSEFTNLTGAVYQSAQISVNINQHGLGYWVNIRPPNSRWARLAFFV